MRLAVINSDTHIVENVAVPPEGSNVWFVPQGYYAVMDENDIAEIGMQYQGNEFV